MPNKKLYTLRTVLFLLLTLIWMGVIFSMSARDSDESSNMSNKVDYAIGEVVIKDFDELSEKEVLSFIEKIDYPVRKCAHAAEYAILGILCMHFLGSIHMKLSRRWYLSLLFCALYAGSDELHQLFSSGRSCQFKDVMIDSSGALFGILIMVSAACIYRKHSHR